jgi:hypothetical protein
VGRGCLPYLLLLSPPQDTARPDSVGGAHTCAGAAASSGCFLLRPGGPPEAGRCAAGTCLLHGLGPSLSDPVGQNPGPPGFTQHQLHATAPEGSLPSTELWARASRAPSHKWSREGWISVWPGHPWGGVASGAPSPPTWSL